MGASRHELQSHVVAWSMLRQPAPEGEIARLDRIEEQRPVGSPVLDEQERCIALELGQSERRLQAADDRLQEVAGDDRRVLQLAA